jgi:hypothetical protein
MQYVIPLHDNYSEFCTISDQFKVTYIQEHVLPLQDLTMFNSAVSSV